MNAYQIEWKDISVPIIKQEDDGIIDHVPGKAAGDTGLGYNIFNPQDDDPDGIPLYGIIHVATGRRIIHHDPILVEDLAKRIVAAIAELNHDWTRPIEEIQADPNTAEIVKQVRIPYRKITQQYYERLEEAREETYWGE